MFFSDQMTSNVNNQLTSNVNNKQTLDVNKQMTPPTSKYIKRDGNLSSGDDKQKSQFIYTGKRGRPPKAKPDQVLDPQEIKREAQWVRTRSKP